MNQIQMIKKWGVNKNLGKAACEFNSLPHTRTFCTQRLCIDCVFNSRQVSIKSKEHTDYVLNQLEHLQL